jgi:hypothetical protein
MYFFSARKRKFIPAEHAKFVNIPTQIPPDGKKALSL